MAITNRDQLINALANNSSRIIIDKSNLGAQSVGVHCSSWRAGGQPAQGAIPTAPALCTNATLGAVGFAQQTAPVTSYIGLLDAVCSNNAATLEIHDRLAHMGGLVLNSTALQTTNLPLDLEALAPSADRIGDPTFGDVQVWIEFYGDGGGTGSNAAINVTFNDDTSGNLNNINLGGTQRVGRCYSLGVLRNASQQGKNIKRINSVQLSASTGVAGNFGFTFTRPRAHLPLKLANHGNKADWSVLGLPEIPNGSCLQFRIIPATSSSGTLRGGGKIIHG